MSPVRPDPPSYSAAELAARVQSQLSQAAGAGATGLSQTAQVGLELGPDQPLFHISHWHYRQSLHEPWSLEIEASATVIADPGALLLQRASFWQRDGLSGFHALSGLIHSFSESDADDDGADLCHYRLTLVPALALLQHSRRERVFQRVTAVELAQAILSEHGLQPVELREIPADLARWRQLSQHRDAAAPHLFETDLHFVRRILAEQGLSLWLEPLDADSGAGGASDGQERLVIGRAGLGAGNAKALPLPLATPAGLLAPDLLAEHLLDLELAQAQTPQTASLWAYNYRDRGRKLRSRTDTQTQPGPSPAVWEEPALGADALSFQGNAAEGIQAWLDAQAQRSAQRLRQQASHLKASSNAAGLWRCGQALNLDLSAVSASLDSRWLLTHIEAGSHLGPWLAPEDGKGEGENEPKPLQAFTHFTASPLSTWVNEGWMPELLHSAPLDLEHARIAATPGASYAYLDPHGRYQLEIRADRQRSKAAHGATSRPARHIRSHAGPDYGWHLPLHEATEVLLSYHAGHADTPMITGALHNSSQPDPVTGRNASRNVLRTWANNKFRLEDRQGEEHIKLSTEFGLSQLNLGHQVTADRQPRGEGFELRSEHWGALRASQGLLISSFAGQPRGGLNGAKSPAHQLYNPGAADAQGAQAMAEQRSEANSQVGLGPLAALKPTRQLVDQAPEISAALIHANSAEHLLVLSPGPQVLAANNISFAAQGQLELASAEQIRLYAKTGISWHTEGEPKASAAAQGKGGSRTDVISHGDDQTQALNGAAHMLAQQDMVLEFHGERALLSANGASLELTQAGVLTITANTDIVVEASSHKIGGALDWAAGDGSAAAGPISYWGQMDVKDVCVECLKARALQRSAFVSYGDGA